MIESARRRSWPVRLILVAIVFVLVLPGLVFCGVLLNQFAEVERDQNRAEALAAAVRAADALDRELGNLAAAVRVLATSAALQTGDLATFDREARAVVGAIGQDVVLLSPTGQQLVNTAAPFGADLPVASSTDTLRRAFQSGRTVASDLFARALGGELTTIMMVPILREGRPAYAIGLYLEPAFLSGILQNQALPPDWMGSVTDSQKRLIARTQDSERFLGKPATRDFQEHAVGSRAVWTGTTLEGTPVLAASAKMALADWRVGVGVPVSIVDAPVRQSVAALALGGAVTLVLGCALAWQLARSISTPLQRLALAGESLRAGAKVDPIRTRIAEVATVARTLLQATSDLQARNETLAAERAQLAAIIETVPVGLMIARAPSGRVIAGNGQLDRMLRTPPSARFDDRFGLAVFDAQDQPVPLDEQPLARALAGAETADLHCRLRRSDGSLMWVHCVAAAIRGADGATTGAVLAVLDIDEVVRTREENARWAEGCERIVAARTAELEAANQRLRDEISARSRAEEQLRQAQKMEAVGRLTGGIAHDFNNMLTVIVGSLDLLRRRAADARAQRLLDNALEGANRAATLTARLLAFSRQQPLVPQPIDVNALVSGMTDLLHRTLGETVQVQTVLEPDLWRAHADPNQLESALLNLAVNARDAILEGSPTGGRLLIETAGASLDEVYAAQHQDVRPGDYVMIAVSDTGTGMPDDVRSRAFEPFFTTKPQGHGTGLGLSQVHGFVKQSGGHVSIYSELGRGTTVKLYLPRVLGAAERAEPSRPEPPKTAHAASAAILLVEDEDGVRSFTAEALRELGYAVLEANGAGPALWLLDQHPEIALLLTDVVMAGQGGRELAEEALRRRPGLPVLFTTGYTRNAIIHDGQLDPGVELIGKPFTIAALGAKVAEVIAGARYRTPAPAGADAGAPIG
ncbi:MAG TPA: ATP-binding protein [Acetobacteraceae bacterium]|nr:ATP-binding protein [Acetobacteraceae bacterium]